MIPSSASSGDALDLEVVLLPQFRQQGEVARGAVAEAEVLADRPRPPRAAGRPAPPGRTPPGQPGELQRELQHADRVRAELAEQLGPAAQGAQQRRVGPGPDHLARVRVEGDHHQRQAQLPRGLGRPGHDPLVAPVHAVEHADGDHARAPSRPAPRPAPASAPPLLASLNARHDSRCPSGPSTSAVPMPATSAVPGARAPRHLPQDEHRHRPGPSLSSTRAISVPSGANAASGPGPAPRPGRRPPWESRAPRRR